MRNGTHERVRLPKPEWQVPHVGLRKWSTPLKRFGEDFRANRDDLSQREYAKLEPLLPEILHLYDLIRRDFLRVRTEIVGAKRAKPTYIEATKGKLTEFEFQFAGLDPREKRLTKGAAYPLLGAFRDYVRPIPETGMAEWEGGFEHIKSVWNNIAPDLFREMQDTIKDIGTAPNVLGKSRSLWARLYKTVENYHLREQLERLNSRGVN